MIMKRKETVSRRSQRECLTEEQVAEIQRKNAAGRKQLRSSMSEQQSISSRLKEREHRYQKRLNLSENDKLAVKMRETKGRQERRKYLSEEETLAVNTRETRGRKSLRQHLSEQERLTVNTRETRGRKSIRQHLSEQERLTVNTRETRGRKSIRQHLSEHERLTVNTRETRGRKSIRQHLSEHERLTVNTRETRGRKSIRQHLSGHERLTVNTRETRGRKSLRQHLSEHERLTVNTRETRGRKSIRQHLSEHERLTVNTRETTGRKSLREDMSEQERLSVNTRETRGRKRIRQDLGEEKKMGLKSKDTRARKHARLDLSEEKILTINTRDTRRRKDLRQHLTTEERSLVKTRETRGRKSIRESLGQEEKQSLRSRETKGKMNIRKAVKKKCTDIDFVANRFRQSNKEGPFYVCCCCRRMLYRHSVLCYSAARYKKTSKTLLESCCSRHSSLQKTYSCKTCDLSLKKNKMPTQGESNNLQFDDVPEALQDLCPLEERLISQRLPFMQIASLPRVGQKGIKGAVVNVPTRLDTIAKTLPRMPMNCGLVPVELKKKLEYRGHSMYQSIRPDVVLHALHTLKENNPLYEDVDLDTDWLKKCMEEEEELCAALIEAEQQLNTSDEESGEESPEKSSDDKEDDTEENAERLRGIPYNTCLQPACEFPEGSVITFAPGEGEHPVSLMTDNQCEVLAFPSLFPSGKFGHNDPSRPVKLPYRRYFNQRLLNEDRRCASNVEYLFYAQYFTELKQVLDNVSIAVRLCKPGQKTAASIKNSIQDMIRENDAYRFLQTVRGSHPYWKRTLHDLCAMV